MNSWEVRYFYVKIDEASVLNPDWEFRVGWNVITGSFLACVSIGFAGLTPNSFFLGAVPHRLFKAHSEGFASLLDELRALGRQRWLELLEQHIQRSLAQINSGRFLVWLCRDLLSAC